MGARAKLYIRSRGGDWAKQRTDVKAKTKLIWKWNYPLISFASNLIELIEFSSLEEKTGTVLISAPIENVFLAAINLDGGNKIVIKPKFLVGITSDVQVKTKWSFNIHNILSGRIRQIILHGNGVVILSGGCGINMHLRDNESQTHRIENNLLIAYETEAEYSLCRTETFWHYFRKRSALFDQKLHNGTFITQTNQVPLSPGKNETFIEKFLNVFLNGVGKILGF